MFTLLNVITAPVSEPVAPKLPEETPELLEAPLLMTLLPLLLLLLPLLPLLLTLLLLLLFSLLLLLFERRADFILFRFPAGESGESARGTSGGDGDGEEERSGDSIGRSGLPGPMASASSPVDESVYSACSALLVSS